MLDSSAAETLRRARDVLNMGAIVDEYLGVVRPVECGWMLCPCVLLWLQVLKG